jgi:hypothetical protein
MNDIPHAEEIAIKVPLPIPMLDDRTLSAEQISVMVCNVIGECIERKVMEWRLANPK